MNGRKGRVRATSGSEVGESRRLRQIREGTVFKHSSFSYFNLSYYIFKTGIKSISTALSKQF